MLSKKILVILFVGFLFLAGCTSAETQENIAANNLAPENTMPKNTILFIGDGMGFEQLNSASMYLKGQANILEFEFFPYGGKMTTHSANSKVTDSAAGGTAIATGVKVNNGVVSMAIPGNGEKLPTMLEHFKANGKKVGLVTTAYITHATPAVFAAHNKSRKSYKQIANDYLNNSKPHLMLGGAKHVSKEQAEKAGYTVVTNREEMNNYDTKSGGNLWGMFGKSYMPYEAAGTGQLPHLSEMTKTAIDALENSDKGFFLMVEGARIDHAGHGNKLKENIFETIEFAKAVKVAADWAAKRDDTLIVVTADHETGGLKVIKNNGRGKLPDVTWSTRSHTGAYVPVFASGKNARRFRGLIDNTDIYRLITQAELNPAAAPSKKAPEKEKATTFTY